MIIWDETKRPAVLERHGIDFAVIEDIFDDTFAIPVDDYAHSEEGEIRYGIIGKTARYGLIVLIFTFDETGATRFITARRAEKWMVNDYEKQRNRY